MIIILATAGLIAAIHLFAALSGRELAKGAAEELAPKVLSGSIKPSGACNQLDLDWTKSLDYVKGPIRRELERLEGTQEAPTFAIDFCETVRGEIPPAISAVDHADASTLAAAMSVVLKRCPAAVFAQEWRRMVNGATHGWSHAFLDAYESQTDLDGDPSGLKPFASIVYQGADAPEPGAKLRAPDN